MSIDRLINRPCTLVTRAKVGETEYGEPIVEEVRTETVCELQQLRRDEPGDLGETSDTIWNCFFRRGEAVSTGTAVEVDGAVYEMVGDPWEARDPLRRVVSHIEATVRRVSGEDS